MWNLFFGYIGEHHRALAHGCNRLRRNPCNRFMLYPLSSIADPPVHCCTQQFSYSCTNKLDASSLFRTELQAGIDALSRQTTTLSERVASVQLTDRSKRELWPIKLGYSPPTTEHWENVPQYPRMLILNSLCCWGRRKGSHKSSWDVYRFQVGPSGPRNYLVSNTKSCLPTDNHNGHFGCVRIPVSQSSSLESLEPISGGLSGLLHASLSLLDWHGLVEGWLTSLFSWMVWPWACNPKGNVPQLRAKYDLQLERSP
jgi:Predicted permease, DMT superfamily